MSMILMPIFQTYERFMRKLYKIQTSKNNESLEHIRHHKDHLKHTIKPNSLNATDDDRVQFFHNNASRSTNAKTTNQANGNTGKPVGKPRNPGRPQVRASRNSQPIKI